MSKANNRFLVEFDCILDTRLAVIQSRDAELAARLALDSKYRLRFSDDISRIVKGFDQTQFVKDYENRTSDTAWGGARLTPFAFMLRDAISESHVSGAYTPMPMESSITINMYPYEIDASAWGDTMADFFGVSQVTFIRKSPEELTPRFIRTNFESISMYDFDKWLNLHIETLKTCALPSVSFHCPTILKQFDTASIKLYQGGYAADSIRTMLALKLSLKMSPLSEFSMIELTT